MGRKPKTVAKSSAAAVEVKSSNLYRGISSSVEKLPPQTPVEGLNTEYNSQPNSNGLWKKRKASMATNGPLRRSGRLKSPAAGTQLIKPTVEHVDLDEIEKEEPLQSEKVNSPLQVVNQKSSEVDTQVEQIVNKKSLEVDTQVEQIVNGKSLEVDTQVEQIVNEKSLEVDTQVEQVLNEKSLEVDIQVEHIVNEKSSEADTRVEQVGPPKDANKKSLNEMVSYFVQAVDEFKHKVSERLDEDPSPDARYKSLYFFSSQKKVDERSDDGPSSDVHYKNLYFNSQKKLEELMKENYELVRKLEFAEGQVAAYEKMIDVRGPLKEVMLVSRFEKSIKDNVSLLPSSTPADDEPKKKKRSYKKRKA
ncbi:Unknown protein [Striga hermonthica]|uniref:Uncharacterized protein n=1 Tax=Striga hermonthica TaxID=68872 RepID=A0A9N7R905_STRHE|nr:Unknown protein [Striga hermonthica]